jgi:Ca2+-binding EF-hand superfamily protein
MKNHSFKLLSLVGGLSLAAVTPGLASEAEDLFQRIDTNGDKKVTSMEHVRHCETMFKQSDADRDGRLSVAEAESAQTAHDKKVDKKATVTYMRLVDTDGDGLISEEESATHGKNAFTRADKNSDGVLSEDEFEDAHQAMKKELKG